MMDEHTPQQRLRVTFGKLGTQKYIGHLDLAKTWERILRRAELGLAYKHGFNARPKIQIVAALPLGITSECELMEIWLEHPIPLEGFAERLRAVSPPGLPVYRVEEIPLLAERLQSLTDSSVYKFTPAETVDKTELARRVQDFRAQKRIVRTYRDKPYDLRPLVMAIELRDEGNLHVEMIQTEQGAGRPDELVDALGYQLADFAVHRTALKLRKG